jgi:hypothetical protein
MPSTSVPVASSPVRNAVSIVSAVRSSPFPGPVRPFVKSPFNSTVMPLARLEFRNGLLTVRRVLECCWVAPGLAGVNTMLSRAWMFGLVGMKLGANVRLPPPLLRSAVVSAPKALRVRES